MSKLLIRVKGGPGSGNFGHAGRPGSVGGSASGSVAASLRTGRAAAVRRGFKPTEKKQGASYAGVPLPPDNKLDDGDVLPRNFTESDVAYEKWREKLPISVSYKETADAIIANTGLDADPGELAIELEAWYGPGGAQDAGPASWQLASSKAFGTFQGRYVSGLVKEHIESGRMTADGVVKGSTTDWTTADRVAAANAMYNYTQDVIAKEFPGKKTFTVYRGTSSAALRDIGSGRNFNMDYSPLSSWTSDFGHAQGYADAAAFVTGKGSVVGFEVPVNRIFSLAVTGIGELDESELVVLPNSRGYNRVSKVWEGVE